VKYVFLGLSITSAWGNGHATTYRSLIRELARRGHAVTFLERDVPWYREHRDLPEPPFGQTVLYQDLDELRTQHAAAVRSADVVIVGSYLPDGSAIAEWVQRTARGLVAFYDIDTPITLAGLEGGTCGYLERQLVPRFDLYLSFTGGPTLERLRKSFGAVHTRALYCSVDPELYFPERQPQDWVLGYLGTYSSDRQSALDELLIEPARQLDEMAFVVAGAQYPELRWPENVARLNHVAPTHHRAFYNRQRFTLNITRREMTRAGYSPSVRLFEAAACGTPIISDIWPGMESFFGDGEILLARSARDVIGYVRDLPSEERVRIGAAARRRILAEHTAAHRAAELDSHVEELLRGSRLDTELRVPQAVEGADA
jgi:spore maturation protein CgeB